MNGLSPSFSAVGAFALAATLVAAAPALANAGHNVYPPGWNTPIQPSGHVLYQFVAGGERYHVVASATAETGTTK